MSKNIQYDFEEFIKIGGFEFSSIKHPDTFRRGVEIEYVRVLQTYRLFATEVNNFPIGGNKEEFSELFKKLETYEDKLKRLKRLIKKLNLELDV